MCTTQCNLGCSCIQGMELFGCSRRQGDTRFSEGKFHTWSGTHWKAMATEKVLHWIIENLGHFKVARKHQDHLGILKTASTLSTAPLPRPSKAGINFANGFLDEGLSLQPHAPAHGASWGEYA